MVYNNLPRERVLEIYDFAMKKRKEGYGQRNIFKMIKQEFKQEMSENTIAGWIFQNNIPFANEGTQFKAKKKPEKDELYNLYIKEKRSAQRIAEKYNVSTIITINWLRYYDIPIRTHLESMNTSLIKEELREKKLSRPTENFIKLSPEKAYILGVLCGDGHINKNFIRFEIRKDEEFAKEFSNCLKNVYGLNFNYKYYAKRDSLVLYAASEIVCKDLMKYGEFGCFEWRAPKEIVICNNHKIIGSFLRGIFDSEGSVQKSAIVMASVSKKGIKDVQDLLRILGIKSKIGITREKYHLLWIFRKQRFKLFRERIGFTIIRKQNKLNEILKSDKNYKSA